MRRLGLAASLLVLASCASKTPDPPATVLGDGSIKDLTPAATSSATSFRTPLDAALSPDGKTAYFIALVDEESAIFKAAAPAAGAPEMLTKGSPLASPFGIDVAGDGATLVIADPGAQVDPEADVSVRGELFTLAASGGTPQVISGATGYRPRGVVLVSESGSEVVYFTGKDPMTQAAGVFKIPLAGGMVTAIAKGDAFLEPAALSVTKDGTVFLVDVSHPESTLSRVLKIKGGVPSVFLPEVAVGYPAGIALSQDEQFVLVSALDPEKRTDMVIRAPAAGGDITTVSSGIDTFEEPAGLHRARNADTFIWADSKANGGGTVFVINKQP